MTKKLTLPEILDAKVVAKSRLFQIESLDLRFSNGVEYTYERMKPSGRHAVMIVPVAENNDLILIREYAAGTERYELGFPKGLIDLSETALEAANRELKEEIGFGANHFIQLKEIVLAPSYFSSKMTLFLAKDLYSDKLKGDEPEPLELIRWPVHNTEALLSHLDFREARSIAALLLAFKQLSG
ncbi:ADP compounds hydrolase NudE [Candidatus Enterovibrio altilux]|uniref:ADP compounds hydrolase NudE n=1 Tax=Candidatus Enterovibrio altilux TaxID=1927128 RepID=A0A291B908_9GAMM|nr:ADP compounds hydrolase NudE [Candidatus Enterovibrio luxaltus]ATF09489.1 ADP compounds hydrolase NudE [Candidatus Enterovibrio luxaltus]